ncbi:MAG: glycosyltransferase [Chloroflexi bacterium]|nr:glycosyltransferase [Chloroflexota bacterium]
MGAIGPANTTFILLSFEGPDRYSMAGGLGMRIAELSRTLAEDGYRTHLLFVGDPHARGLEERCGERLVLHRWCQWISKYYPGGVYQGEEEKLYDFNESLPWFVVERLARPAIEAGHVVVVMGEEWHTAEAMCRISDTLWGAGLRDRAVLLWNANNTMGFDRVNWGRLGFVSTITTVSRYMKHIMWDYGINPLVIPNGIPRRLLRPVDHRAANWLRRSVQKPVVLSKVGRWDPDKRWLMAVETVARLKERGQETVLVARGGVEPHEGEVLHHARSLGLVVKDVSVPEQSVAGYVRAFSEAGPADVLNVKSFIPLEFLRLLYSASDVVLANSGREPFGLVALETMASGGVAFTGATGEDYVAHLENAIVLETEDPEEASWHVRSLKEHPAMRARIGRAARRTARGFVWERVVDNLVGKIEFLAAGQGAIKPTPRTESTVPRAFEAALAAAIDEPEPAIDDSEHELAEPLPAAPVPVGAGRF